MQTPTMNIVRWLRVGGDTIFAVGVFVLGWFVLGLKTGWSVADHIDPDMPVRETASTSPS